MIKEKLSCEEASVLFKLLGDKTRLAMVSLLSADDICVCEFVDYFQMSQPSVSQHLRKLRDKGLVKERKQGQWVFYSLNEESEYYPLAKAIVAELPDPKEELARMEKEGLRVDCC
ncbi:ArsR/SmtB family transcription factor [Alkalicoccus saliphilus]|jgi:ArsR family transcriptional regulator, arsenate/arsenite/antimonite-responsive transcriptional repressor|uniref:ArsR family transcriptional regulator n=1 Tax=Alkalicoccus saliphilus TaxID=200989 RepID=A0A2T4U3A2_9BACI|nr:metalloregulator ArsR/SmtB family transcription factor [Alkalicoccus saliphilus]PTL37878.1 ArsR family transcriptional regulator [Alkalicoccus saliphilus]